MHTVGEFLHKLWLQYDLGLWLGLRTWLGTGLGLSMVTSRVWGQRPSCYAVRKDGSVGQIGRVLALQPTVGRPATGLQYTRAPVVRSSHYSFTFLRLTVTVLRDTYYKHLCEPNVNIILINSQQNVNFLLLTFDRKEQKFRTIHTKHLNSNDPRVVCDVL